MRCGFCGSRRPSMASMHSVRQGDTRPSCCSDHTCFCCVESQNPTTPCFSLVGVIAAPLGEGDGPGFNRSQFLYAYLFMLLLFSAALFFLFIAQELKHADARTRIFHNVIQEPLKV